MAIRYHAPADSGKNAHLRAAPTFRLPVEAVEWYWRDMDKLELVRRIDLFSALSDVERAAVAVAARPRVIEEGEVVCREGEVGRTFYAVGVGALSVGKGEPPTEVAVIEPGQYFGEMSLLTGEPRTATVTARTRTEVLEFDRPAFMKLFSQNVAVARAVSEVVAARQIALQTFAEESRRKVVYLEEESGAIFGRIKQLFGLA